MRALALIAMIAACGDSSPKREIDLGAIKVEGAHMRTDRVGEGEWETTATFVLVDARNTAAEGAYVTLGGELLDGGGSVVSTLIPQSLWIPPGEARTFAIVDKARKPHPEAKSARALVKGAVVLPAPVVHVEGLHTFDNFGQLVLQADIVNDANRAGTVMVIASFHDAAGKPVKRPYTLIKMAGHGTDDSRGDCPEASDETRIALTSKCGVRFVGPVGSVSGDIYIGDTVY